MFLGLSGGLVSARLIAAFDQRLDTIGIAALGALFGLVGFAMPAMTSVALAAAGPRRTGSGAALLNATRQAGGALGVALLGGLTLPRTAQVAHCALPWW